MYCYAHRISAAQLSFTEAVQHIKRGLAHTHRIHLTVRTVVFLAIECLLGTYEYFSFQRRYGTPLPALTSHGHCC
jgi:hypothetical protein